MNIKNTILYPAKFEAKLGITESGDAFIEKIKESDLFFVGSENIKVFPCSWRGANLTTNITGDSIAASELSMQFNPESTLHTEYNLTRTAGAAKTFIDEVNNNGNIFNFKFFLNGYAFEIYNLDISRYKIATQEDNLKSTQIQENIDLYAHIRVGDLQVGNNTIDTTKVLMPYTWTDLTSPTILDTTILDLFTYGQIGNLSTKSEIVSQIKNGIWPGGCGLFTDDSEDSIKNEIFDTYVFTGLALSTEPLPKNNADDDYFSIQLLSKGKVRYTNRWPKEVTAGQTTNGDSTMIGDNESLIADIPHMLAIGKYNTTTTISDTSAEQTIMAVGNGYYDKAKDEPQRINAFEITGRADSNSFSQTAILAGKAKVHYDSNIKEKTDGFNGAEISDISTINTGIKVSNNGTKIIINAGNKAEANAGIDIYGDLNICNIDNTIHSIKFKTGTEKDDSNQTISLNIITDKNETAALSIKGLADINEGAVEFNNPLGDSIITNINHGAISFETKTIGPDTIQTVSLHKPNDASGTESGCQINLADNFSISNIGNTNKINGIHELNDIKINGANLSSVASISIGTDSGTATKINPSNIETNKVITNKVESSENLEVQASQITFNSPNVVSSNIKDTNGTVLLTNVASIKNTDNSKVEFTSSNISLTSNNINVDGRLAVKNGAEITGNTDIIGNTNINGTIDINGNLNTKSLTSTETIIATKDIKVSGNISVDNTISASNITTNTVTVDTANVNNTLTVSSNIKSLAGGLEVKTHLNIANAVIVTPTEIRALGAEAKIKSVNVSENIITSNLTSSSIDTTKLDATKINVVEVAVSSNITSSNIESSNIVSSNIDSSNITVYDTLKVNNLIAASIAHSDGKDFNFEVDANSIFTESLKALIFNAVYPVGSIYMSMDDTNPANKFGGKWKQISQGRTLLGAGNDGEVSYSAGETGGSKDITVIPSHKHTINTVDTTAAECTWVIPNDEFNTIKLDVALVEGEHTHIGTALDTEISEHKHSIPVTMPISDTHPSLYIPDNYGTYKPSTDTRVGFYGNNDSDDHYYASKRENYSYYAKHLRQLWDDRCYNTAMGDNIGVIYQTEVGNMATDKLRQLIPAVQMGTWYTPSECPLITEINEPGPVYTGYQKIDEHTSEAAWLTDFSKAWTAFKNFKVSELITQTGKFTKEVPLFGTVSANKTNQEFSYYSEDDDVWGISAEFVEQYNKLNTTAQITAANLTKTENNTTRVNIVSRYRQEIIAQLNKAVEAAISAVKVSNSDKTYEETLEIFTTMLNTLRTATWSNGAWQKVTNTGAENIYIYLGHKLCYEIKEAFTRDYVEIYGGRIDTEASNTIGKIRDFKYRHDDGAHQHTVNIDVSGNHNHRATVVGSDIRELFRHKHETIPMPKATENNTQNTDGTNANLPPYLVCYIWQRMPDNWTPGPGGWENTDNTSKPTN